MAFVRSLAILPFLFFCNICWSAVLAEVQWAEPFVVRAGETISLNVVGRNLPQQATVTIYLDGNRDRKIRVLDWEWQSARAARLSIEISADAEPGLRGLGLLLSDRSEVRQDVCFRVADSERLPWPHEPPNASPQQRENIRNQVFVINNFGLFQGSDNPQQTYFHDGLDIVLPQGTPIYALADGVVRYIFLSSNVGSRYIAVEDLDRPGFGWMYVHTDHFLHAEGEIVRKGERIADVADFNGLEHIHLSRTYVPDRKSWGKLSNLHDVFADDFFDLRDSDRPVFDRRLWLFRNETSDALPRVNGRLVATGDVDIVLGIRDPGHYAHSKDPAFPVSFGDRLAPAVVRCEILNATGERVAQWTRDMTRTVLRWQDKQRDIWAPERVNVVFLHPSFIPRPQSDARTYSYYVLTNASEINPVGEIQPDDSANSWRTAARKPNGERLFPDGLYTIRITAWDSVGNRSTRRYRTEIRN